MIKFTKKQDYSNYDCDLRSGIGLRYPSVTYFALSVIKASASSHKILEQFASEGTEVLRGFINEA